MALKRTALARKTPMARTAFPQRHPAEAPRTDFRPRSTLTPGKRKTRAKMPPGVALEVKRQSRGRCVRCGTRRALQRHHVLPVARWPQYETEALNMVLACAGCHDEHERAHRRLRLDELPPAVVAFARTRGGIEALYLDKVYG